MEYCAIIQNTIFQIAEIIEPVIISTINRVSTNTLIYIEEYNISSNNEYTNTFEKDSSREFHNNNTNHNNDDDRLTSATNSTIQYQTLSLIHPDECPLEIISDKREEYDNREGYRKKRDFWYLD